MNKLDKYINNTNALQMFHLLRFAATFLIGIMLVKLGYEKEAVADYEYFLFLAAMGSFFWINGLSKTILSLFSKSENVQRSQLINGVYIAMISISIIISLLLIIANAFLNLVSTEVIFLLSFYILFTSVGALAELMLLLQDKSKQILSYGISIYLLQFIILLTILWMGMEIRLILFGLVSWSFLRFVYSLSLWIKAGWEKVSWASFSYLILFALPLMGESLMGNAMEYVDGSLVKYFFDDATFALYRYGARELPFSILFVAAIGASMLPLMTKDLALGLSEMKQSLYKLIRWLFPLSIVLMLSSSMIFGLVYDEAYQFSSRIFNIYLLIIVSRVIMPQVILLSKHQNYVLLWISLIELLLNLVLSLILLHYYGVIGIPMASLIAFMVIKVSMVIYIWKKYNIAWSQYVPLKSFWIYSMLLVISFIISISMVQ